MDEKSITEFIQSFGGQTALATALSVKVTTVDSWRRRGNIPHWRLDALRKACKRFNVDMRIIE